MPVSSSDTRAVGAARPPVTSSSGALLAPAPWLHAQIVEIRDDPVLRIYGAGLSLSNLLSVLFWRSVGEQQVLGREAEPICWPLLPQCAQWRVLGADQVRQVLAAFALASAVVALLFLARRFVTAAYLGLLALNVVKLGLVALDYRMRHNQHYMAFWAAAVFLFVPAKRDALRVLIVLFYVWAGTLKLNWEWISGDALYRPLWFFTGVGVVVACVYVVVMELAISWGLLASRAWVFWGTFAQVALFHLMSWAVVDFFYPLLMFLLISIYPLVRLWPPGDHRGLLEPLFRGRLRPAVYVPAGAFCLLQLTPYTFPGDRTITGEGRLYALHMFDARVACEAYATVRSRDGTVRQVDLRLTYMPRINCDPIVVFGRARNLCEGRSPLAADVDALDLHLAARHPRETSLHEVIHVPDFCRSGLQYDPFRHNPWIRSP